MSKTKSVSRAQKTNWKLHRLGKVKLTNITRINGLSQARVAEADETTIKNMVNSIELTGLKEPVVVIKSKNNRYILIDGTHRYKALTILAKRHQALGNNNPWLEIDAVEFIPNSQSSFSLDSIRKSYQIYANSHTDKIFTANSVEDIIANLEEQVRFGQEGIFRDVNFNNPNDQDQIDLLAEAINEWLRDNRKIHGLTRGKYKGVVNEVIDRLGGLKATQHVMRYVEDEMMEMIQKEQDLQFFKYNTFDTSGKVYSINVGYNDCVWKCAGAIQRMVEASTKLTTSDSLTPENMPTINVYACVNVDSVKSIKSAREKIQKSVTETNNHIRQNYTGLSTHKTLNLYYIPQIVNKENKIYQII